MHLSELQWLLQIWKFVSWLRLLCLPFNDWNASQKFLHFLDSIMQCPVWKSIMKVILTSLTTIASHCNKAAINHQIVWGTLLGQGQKRPSASIRKRKNNLPFQLSHWGKIDETISIMLFLLCRWASDTVREWAFGNRGFDSPSVEHPPTVHEKHAGKVWPLKLYFLSFTFSR